MVSIAIPTEEESTLTMPTARENAPLEGRSEIKIKVVNEKVVLIADSMARHVNIKGVLTFYTRGVKYQMLHETSISTGWRMLPIYSYG